jgi:putative transposase
MVSDNGTKFTSNAISRWADRHKVAWHNIAPGKPAQMNPSSDGYGFRSLAHTWAVFDFWRADYTTSDHIRG